MAHEHQSPVSATIDHQALPVDELDFPAPGENVEFPNGGNSDPIGSGGGSGQPANVTATSAAWGNITYSRG